MPDPARESDHAPERDAARADDLPAALATHLAAGEDLARSLERHRESLAAWLAPRLGMPPLPAGQAGAVLQAIAALLGPAIDKARGEREQLRATLAAERRAVAADLHDAIGQSLAYVKLRLPLLQDAIARGETAQAERYFDDVREAVGQAHSSLRGILAHFRTPIDPLGLAHAIEEAVHSFRRNCSTALELDNQVPALRLAPEQEAQLFHIVQEALSNVARHAAARHAWLSLRTSEQGALLVQVSDDGAGLNQEEGSAAGGSHYGLAIMRERAQRLGATLHIAPRAGGGTCVSVELPLACRDNAQADRLPAPQEP